MTDYDRLLNTHMHLGAEYNKLLARMNELQALVKQWNYYAETCHGGTYAQGMYECIEDLEELMNKEKSCQ